MVGRCFCEDFFAFRKNLRLGWFVLDPPLLDGVALVQLFYEASLSRVACVPLRTIRGRHQSWFVVCGLLLVVFVICGYSVCHFVLLC